MAANGISKTDSSMAQRLEGQVMNQLTGNGGLGKLAKIVEGNLGKSLTGTEAVNSLDQMRADAKRVMEGTTIFALA